MTKSRGLRVAKGTRPQWVAENEGRHLCQCGCGRAVNLRPEYYPEVPRYIRGHNPTRTAKALPPREQCECGCGGLAGPGKRFVSGHNGRGIPRTEETRAKIRAAHLGPLSHRYRVRPHNFKGRIYHSDGYVLIWTPDHPFSSNGRVFEHRLVMEEHLRTTDPNSRHLVRLGDQLYLSPESVVHHIDSIRDNNETTNLQPMTRADHDALHRAERSG